MDYDAENKQLLREYRNTKDSELLSDLYIINQGLFYKIVSKYTGLCEHDDMMQECFFALIKAINTYQEELGEFSTYLTVVTNNYIKRFVNANKSITAPEYMQVLTYKYQELKNRRYSDKNVLKALNISQEQLQYIKNYLLIQRLKSLDAPIKSESNTILGDSIADPTEYQEQVVDSVFCEEITRAVERAKLSEREKSFLFQRFYENKTYLEIDPEHSRSNTRNIIEKALRKLRKNDSLQKLYSETNVYICNGLAYFRTNQTSGVERLILKAYE